MSRFVPSVMMVLVLGLNPALPAAAQAAPQIGDKAPMVKASKWMNEAPPKLPGEDGSDKYVYLVEFWATWCKPCLACIPHLADLHQKHRADGLIVIGVSNEDPEKIAKFLKDGAKSGKLEMPYAVACDDEMATTEAWTKDIDTIPHAFVVDRKGVVVWSGNPLARADSLDQTIEQVLAGKYDIEAAKRAAAADQKFEALLSDLKIAYTSGEGERVFKILDQMIEIKPAELQPYLIRRQMLSEFNMEDQIAEWDVKTEAAMQNSADGLRDLVLIELGKPLAERNPGLMMRCAQRCTELTQGRDPESLSVLAQVQCQLGMLDEAISTQKQAVALASGGVREELERVLRYFEGAKALSQ